MWRLIFAAPASLLVACITVVVAPTATPFPESTVTISTTISPKQPTTFSTRANTSPPPTLVIASSCISWREARAHVGENICVTGIVTRVFTDPRSRVTFIDFSTERAAYTAFSPQIIWEASLVGKCVKIFGAIVLFNDQPETVINSKEQLMLC
ncbi:MAG: hypothetical protein HY257_03975 [Chloroflexi bacterium]|nr:hypothetical protein [Chloroflexota bacterium]